MSFTLTETKLIVGLGNVGAEYAKTRHNAGFLFADKLAEVLSEGAEWHTKGDFKAEYVVIQPTTANGLQQNLVVAKPTTMMNNSGEAVQAIASFYRLKPAEILVAHDDMDVPIGGFKIQFDKGPKVHNGVDSVERMLGTTGFWRLRIGIENREVKGNKGIPGLKYALQRFGEEELISVDATFNKILGSFTLG